MAYVIMSLIALLFNCSAGLLLGQEVALEERAIVVHEPSTTHLLDLPEDMLAQIAIYTATPELGNTEQRASLEAAIEPFKSVLSASKASQAAFCKAKVAGTLLKYCAAQYKKVPLYIAVQLHQSSLIELIRSQNDLGEWIDRSINPPTPSSQSGLMILFDQKNCGVMRPFRGQIREALAMILADTHDTHRFAKASFLERSLNQDEKITSRGFGLILNKIITKYKVDDTQTIIDILERKPEIDQSLIYSVYSSFQFKPLLLILEKHRKAVFYLSEEQKNKLFEKFESDNSNDSSEEKTKKMKKISDLLFS